MSNKLIIDPKTVKRSNGTVCGNIYEAKGKKKRIKIQVIEESKQECLFTMGRIVKILEDE